MTLVELLPQIDLLDRVEKQQLLEILTTQLQFPQAGNEAQYYLKTPDQFFTAEQQQRLAELMTIWSKARDLGKTLPPEQQSELDGLIEAELYATAERSKAILDHSQT